MKLFSHVEENDILSIVLVNGNMFRLEVLGEDNFILIGVSTRPVPMTLTFTVSRTASDGSIAAVLFSKEIPVGRESKDAWMLDDWRVLTILSANPSFLTKDYMLGN